MTYGNVPPSPEVENEEAIRRAQEFAQLDKITKLGVIMMVGSAVLLGVGIEIGGTVEDISMFVGTLGEAVGFSGAMIWTRH